ncbi:MAG: hypothetical protein IT314_10075 [Anaerolineales bacterium]|nr:hypothetical protein [Anaerolineales bacterium]
MNLLERYVAEVGRHLPEKDRADIEAEIRSTLEDGIEEKGGANEANIKSVLQEFGDPASLAEKYSPAKRYLIGPLWYDAYLETLKRALATALPVFLIVNFLVGIANQPGNAIGSFLDAAGNTFYVAVQIVFWVTLGFIIAEQTDADPKDAVVKQTRTWTPDQLPPLPRKRQMDISEVGTSLALVIGGAILIAWSPQILSIQSHGETIPFLHPDLWNVFLPIFFVLVGFTVIHELFKLAIGNWTRALTVTNLILGIASITYIVLLIATQQVFNPSFVAALAESGARGIQDATSWATWTINITAAIIIGIYIWDMVDSVIKSRRLVASK